MKKTTSTIALTLLKPFLKITGTENIPNGNYIIAANHASYIDSAIILAIFWKHTNKKIWFIAKKEHFDKKWKAKIHSLAGAVPIDRKNGQETIAWATNELTKGNIIAIHPEGTRTLTGKLLRGKTGIARMALQAKVPVIPVGIKGTFEILPKGKTIPKPGRIEIKIGKPIRFQDEENNYETLRKTTDQIMKKIAELTGQEYSY